MCGTPESSEFYVVSPPNGSVTADLLATRAIRDTGLCVPFNHQGRFLANLLRSCRVPRVADPEVPVLSFPTPNPNDRIITELVSKTKGEYREKFPGERHPNQRDYPNHVFLGQIATENHEYITEVYLNERAAQSQYNADIGFVGQSVSHPEFRRRYLVRRTAPASQGSTRGLPLTGVVHLTITNAGSSYEYAPTVSFSGGGGSGAEALAFVFRGEVVALFITAEGSGYTSAPTVSFSSGGGSGAAATAHIQPTTAILVAEDFQRMPGEPADSLFLIATRIYKTLPGPEVFSKSVRPDGTLERSSRQDVVASTLPTAGAGYLKDEVQGVDSVQSVREKGQLTQADGTTLITNDTGFTLYSTDDRTLALTGTTFRIRPYGETLPAPGSAFGLGTITNVKTQRIPGSTNVLQIIEHWSLPEPRVAYPEVAVPFPGIHIAAPFTVNSEELAESGLRFPPPWVGDGRTPGTYYQLKPRNRKVVGREVRSYTVGPSGWSPAAYQVYTPGTASRLFNIPDNTVHGPLRIIEQLNGVNYTVENIPASTPSTYDARQILTFPLGEMPLDRAGTIYERRVLQVSEATSPFDFPPVHAAKIFVADGEGTFSMQPNPGGDQLSIVSSNAGDTMRVTIYGKKENPTGVFYGEETITLTGTTPVLTDPDYEWFTVTQVHLSSAPAGTITIGGAGLGAFGTMLIFGTVSEGSRVEVGRTGLTITYTFRSPARATLAITDTSSVSQGDYFDQTFVGSTKRFWVDIDDAGTGAPADPGGGLFRLDFTTGNTAPQNAAIVKTAMETAWEDELFVAISSATLTLTGIVMEAYSFTDGVSATGFTSTIIDAGTTDAAYQVRRGWDEVGVAMSAEDEAAALVKAVNASGNAGRDYGTGTTAHPDLSASYYFFESISYRISFVGRQSVPLGATWVLSDLDSDPDISVGTIADGASGPTIVTVPPGSTDVFEDINFDNTTLVLTAVGWVEEEASPYGAIKYNMPAYIGEVTTDPVALPGVQPLLRLVGTGRAGMPVDYETSDDGTIWTPGLTTIPDIGGQNLYDIRLAETDVNFIRLNITNNEPKARAVHAEVFYEVDV